MGLYLFQSRKVALCREARLFPGIMPFYNGKFNNGKGRSLLPLCQGKAEAAFAVS